MRSKVSGLEEALKVSSKTGIPVFTHFWVVKYRSGKAIAQFNPFDFHEVFWWQAVARPALLRRKVRAEDYRRGRFRRDIERLAWLPISKKMSKELRKREIPAISLPFGTLTMELSRGDIPYMRREVEVKSSFTQGVKLRFVRAYKVGKNVGTDYEILESMKVLEGIELLPKT